MRKGKINLENISGGEVTSSPLLSTPTKYSRLLQNFYINSEGHIQKVPGYSSVSQRLADIRILTGIDFKKSDGSSLILVGGRTTSFAASKSLASNGITSRLVTFTGTGTNDLTTNTAYTGSGSAVFTIEVAQGYAAPQYDVWRWKKDSGSWNYFGGTDPLPDEIELSDGVTISIATDSDHTTGDKWVFTCRNPHLEDISLTGTYTGSEAATFDVEIDAEGTPDTFKWRKNDGAYTTGVAITGAAQLLSDGISVTFAATTGHSYSFSWTITASPTTTTGALYRLDNGLLSSVKNDFASLNPLYLSQMGDLVVASNNSDRPVAYDGSTLTNINMPYGNSTQFVGSGLNDFTAKVTFTYEDATYEVEIDSVGTTTIIPTFFGSGINDMACPNPNFSGDAATATFDIQIDGTGGGDTIKYNVNGGPYVTGQSLTILAGGTTIGPAKLKANATFGHNGDDVYEFKVSSNGTPDKFQWRKNSGAWSAELNCDTLYTVLDSNYSLAFISDTGNIVDDIFSFQVDGATTPDTFQWRKDGGAWTTGVNIVAGAIPLSDGISVRFSYFTGHTLTNSWALAAARDTVKYREIGGAYTTGQLITGAFQTIVAGVQFKFNAINGHTLGDKWTIPITQNVRFGKTYVHKNRLWAIGNDRLTAYHSDLQLPTDFTGDGAGYIDFRFVLPVGDELLDISGALNYLVFFFRNHIVIYSGTDPTASGDFAIYQLIANMGIVAAKTVVNVGTDIFFLTDKGVKNLRQVINAGAMNVDNVSAAIDQDIVDAVKANSSGVYDSAHYAKYGLVLFLIGTTIFVYNYRNGSWSRIVIPSANDVSKVLSMFRAHDGSLYMGGYDYLFQFDPAVATYNFAGQAPTYKWKTGMLKVTTAESLFFTEMLLRLASFKAATLTVKARAIGFDTGYEDQSDFNEQTVTITASTPSDIVMNFARAPLFGAGKYIQLEITETPSIASNDDLEITGLDIHGEIGII